MCWVRFEVRSKIPPRGEGGRLGLIFAGYVPRRDNRDDLTAPGSQRIVPVIDPILVTFGQIRAFVRPGTPGPLLGYFSSRRGYFIRRCL